MDIVDTAIKLDKLIMPSKRTFGQMKNIGKFKDHEIIILETGMSGEPIQALQLMAQGRHRQVKMQEGDLVLLLQRRRLPLRQLRLGPKIDLLSEIRLRS